MRVFVCSIMSQFQLVRYKVGGKHQFEIMVKPGTVLKYREGKIESLDAVLFSDMVFSNQSKAERANDSDLKDAFQTTDAHACCKIILEKGEYQMSTAERKEKLEQKRKGIVNYLHKYYTDPRTKLPHPVARIEGAIQDKKIRIDMDLPAEKQAQDMVSKLVELIPLKKSEMEGTVVVPHKHVGVVSGFIRKYVTVKNENYDGHGCTMEVTLVPGDYDTLMKELQRATNGEYQFDIVGQETTGVSPAEDVKKGKKNKKGRK